MAMGKSEAQPITEKNLDQAVERLARLNVRWGLAMTAQWAASLVGLLAAWLLFCVLVNAASASPESLRELDEVPLLKSVVVFAADFLNMLPEAWYIRIPAYVAAIFIPASILYQLVRVLVAALLRCGQGGLRLPKEQITRAKKLYRTAERLGNYNENIPGKVISGGMIFILLILLLPSAIADIANAGDRWLEPLATLAIGFPIGMAIIWGLEISFCSVNSLVGAMSSGDRKQLQGLRDELHKYWMSVDPKEKARVEAEELRKWREKHKASRIASQSGGAWYSDSFTSSLTDKDHDELDAIKDAMDNNLSDGV